MNMEKLLSCRKNENVVLMNTIYHKSRRTENGYSDDAISLIIKDLKSGEKKNILIENPNIEAYVVKDSIDIKPIEYILFNRDKLNKVELNYRYRLRDTAKIMGNDWVQFYWNCLKNKNMRALDEIKKWNRIFSSDWDIEDFYRYKCLEHFGIKDYVPLTKGFLDIETDLDGYELDLKTVTGTAPVNAVTVIDDNKKVSYTLLLRDETNTQIKELEDNIDDFITDLNNEFDKEFGHLDYNIIFYDKEIDLIKDLFLLINSLKLDFIMIWNMSFDIQYLIHRIIQNGYKPEDIICDPTFKFKECYYHRDTMNQKIKLKTDYFRVSSHTCFIDQMITYGAVRSAQKELDSYSLDSIGALEVGSTKLDYNKIGATIKTLPRVNYNIFVKYNIKDVLLQVAIERKVKDIDLLFKLSYDSATRVNKAFKKSIFLRNIGFMFFKEQGLILGNNFNILKDNTNDEKFEGALVGDPSLNDYQGVILHHKKYINKYLENGELDFILRSKSVIKDGMDYDYTSLYPSIIRLFNIFMTTQFGRIYLDKDKINSREVVLDYKLYDRGGKFIDDIELNEAILFLYRWFNLPSAEDVLNGFRCEDNQIRKLELGKLNDDNDIKIIKLERTDGIA